MSSPTLVRDRGIGLPGGRADVLELAGNRKGPCRPFEGEEETEVPRYANTVAANLVPVKAKSYAPMRRGPLTSAFSGREDNIGQKSN